MGNELGELTYNKLTAVKNGNANRYGIACGGISYAYVQESLQGILENNSNEEKSATEVSSNIQNLISNISILKVGTPHPFPEKLALDFIKNLDEVLVVEELDPMIERMLLKISS